MSQMKNSFFHTRRNNRDWRGSSITKGTSETKCARQRDDQNKIDNWNSPNPDKQGVLYFWGIKRRCTYQSWTSHRPSIQSTLASDRPANETTTSRQRQTNSQRRHINAQILRGMRTSHTSSDITPRTSYNWTLQGDTRTNGKTPRDNKNDPRMQIK